VPNGTRVQFGDLFANQDFVARLTQEISRNYPALVAQIDAQGLDVDDFIRGLGYMYGAR
jgi:hypothetical protein